MSFFRSAAVRRVFYVLVFALALIRLAGHLHSEPRRGDGASPSGTFLPDSP
jgi:hypothetical protein